MKEQYGGHQNEVSRQSSGIIKIQDPLEAGEWELHTSKLTYGDGSLRFCLESPFMGLQIMSDTHRGLENTLMRIHAMLTDGLLPRDIAEDLQSDGVSYVVH